MAEQSTDASRDASHVTVRVWQPEDDAGLRRLLEAQVQSDPNWPPDYAKGGDLAEWLGAPATLGRWVAEAPQHAVVGHVGVGPVGEGEMTDLWRAALPADGPPLAEICRGVVDVRWRRYGVLGMLTRRAVRSAIESGHMPVCNALVHREASRTMLDSAGWQVVGSVISTRSGHELLALIAPPKLIAAALERHRSA